MLEKLIDLILSPFIYLPIIYVVVGMISYRLIKGLIKGLFTKKHLNRIRDRKRCNTIMQVLIDTVKVIIVVLVVLAILSVYGVDVSSILAGLGIVSLVLGLASQDLIKDFISGTSIILEDYFSVGDIIEVNGFKGEVVHIGVKTTKIKKWDGPVMMISNRNITTVINHSTENTTAVVDVEIAYEEGVEKAIKVLEKTFDNIKENEFVVGDITVLGVEELKDSSVAIRITAVCSPQKHFIVQRLMRQEFKKALNKAGIKIPYPQIEVHNGK